MTAGSAAVCHQRSAGGVVVLRGLRRLGRAADRGPLPGGSGRLRAVRGCLPGLRQRHRGCVRPRIPGFAPDGLGPHTSSGFPRAFLRIPVCPRDSPPSPALLWFPVVRRSPVGSLLSAVARFRVPLSVSLRGPFPQAILTIMPSGEFPQALVPGGQDQGPQSGPPSARIPPVIGPHSGGAAAGHDGMPPRNRRPRAQDTRRARTGMDGRLVFYQEFRPHVPDTIRRHTGVAGC
jgi:hypothetical protein